MILLFIFFFQAEDGIRGTSVTGVQTCALPISRRDRADGKRDRRHYRPLGESLHARRSTERCDDEYRSEERRVGKSVGRGGRRGIDKKKDTKNKQNEKTSKKETRNGADEREK